MESEELNERNGRSILLLLALILSSLIAIVLFCIFQPKDEEVPKERNFDFELMDNAQTNLHTMEAIRKGVDNILAITDEIREENEMLRRELATVTKEKGQLIEILEQITFMLDESATNTI